MDDLGGLKLAGHGKEHKCLPLQLYHICSGKSAKSIGRSGNTDSLSEVPDSVIHETTTTNKHGLSNFP